jgi:hypothetical protein
MTPDPLFEIVADEARRTIGEVGAVLDQTIRRVQALRASWKGPASLPALGLYEAFGRAIEGVNAHLLLLEAAVNDPAPAAAMLERDRLIGSGEGRMQ